MQKSIKTSKTLNEWLQQNNKYKCPECGKEYSKKGITSHIWRAHTDEGKLHKLKTGYDRGTRNAWNKGLTKETDERVKKYAETNKSAYKNGIRTPSFKGKTHTIETRKKISEKMSLNNKGGRCKWYEYIKKDGSIMKVQGTYELRFAKILDIIDNIWIKIGVGNKEHSFTWYDSKNQLHYYTPDFYCFILNKYFEVKGRWWGTDKEKMNQVLLQNPVNIEIIKLDDIKIYENKYKL